MHVTKLWVWGQRCIKHLWCTKSIYFNTVNFTSTTKRVFHAATDTGEVLCWRADSSACSEAVHSKDAFAIAGALPPLGGLLIQGSDNAKTWCLHETENSCGPPHLRVTCRIFVVIYVLGKKKVTFLSTDHADTCNWGVSFPRSSFFPSALGKTKLHLGSQIAVYMLSMESWHIPHMILFLPWKELMCSFTLHMIWNEPLAPICTLSERLPSFS